MHRAEAMPQSPPWPVMLMLRAQGESHGRREPLKGGAVSHARRSGRGLSHPRVAIQPAGDRPQCRPRRGTADVARNALGEFRRP